MRTANTTKLGWYLRYAWAVSLLVVWVPGAWAQEVGQEAVGEPMAIALAAPIVPEPLPVATPPTATTLGPIAGEAILGSVPTTQISTPSQPWVATAPGEGAPSTPDLDAAIAPGAAALGPINGPAPLPAQGVTGDIEIQATGNPGEPAPTEPEATAPDTNAFQLELTPTDVSRIPADGRSTLELTGQITDGRGRPLDYDVVVTLTTSGGSFLGADYDADGAGFQVLARRGQFRVTLRSGLTAQTVEVRAWVDGFAARNQSPAAIPEPPADLEATAQVFFITDLRPTLLSGYVDVRLGGAGTNFWGSFQDFLRPDLIGATQLTTNAGAFAIGTTGEWQFTGAFNTERALNQTCNGNRLFRDLQFCEQRYPVYGDSSQNTFLTPSISNVYLRFQRDSTTAGAPPDYFMWGDYNTQEFATLGQQFTATTRQLHGFKANYSFGDFQVTALYANNLRTFQRDTLVPDGTSGFYFLSRRGVLPGSEDIFLEVEEFNRPGVVLERRALRRGADYEIDYDRGTLLFRQPVRVAEVDTLGNTRVRRIVATYQVDGVGSGGNLYGGRIQFQAQPGQPQAGGLGITGLWEDQGIQQFRLVGADGILPLGAAGRLVAEVAYSSLTLGNRTATGLGYRLDGTAELGPGFTIRGFFQSTDSGFINTATTSFRPGQSRWGGSVRVPLGSTTALTAQFDQETNLGRAPQVTTQAEELLLPGQYGTPGAPLDNTITTVRAGLRQQLGVVTAGVDFVNRSRRDRIQGVATDTQQIVSQLQVPISDSLSFQALNEVNLGNQRDTLYPTRTTVGLNWTLRPGVSVRLSQQFSSDRPGSVTSLETLNNYELGDNTTLTSRYSLVSGYNGVTGQSAIGLNHRVVLAPGFRMTVGFERIASDSFVNTGSGQQFAQPFAVGLGGSALGLQAATAYSLGLEYTNNPDFQASTRLEHRDSPTGSNTVFSLAAAGRVTPALTGLFRFQRANYGNQTITGNLGSTQSLRLGLAYRDPASDLFNGLLSYEYRQNPSTTPTSLLISNAIGSSDHTFAFEGIYAPSWQWEFYTKYAFRFSTATLSQDLSVNNSVQFAQFRTTYRFAYQWDVLGEIRWITQPTSRFQEVGFALELGYHLSPDVRVGLGYSFGSVNSQDLGGAGFRSASGPYLGIQARVNRLFDGFGLQPVAPPQQRESHRDAPTAVPAIAPQAALGGAQP